MKIEIWSDIACPFCYIGKRKLESALLEFPHRNQVDIIWKSYQLAPDIVTDPSKNAHQFLAQHKGISEERAKSLNNQVTEMAAESGLNYQFDIAITANSFHAHRLSHLAMKHNIQNQIEEKLFSAYFTEGKNVGDIDTLINIGVEAGLNREEVSTYLHSEAGSEEVRADIYEAFQIGVQGVPFYVFDRKYAISGAQDVSVFIQTLQQTFEETK